MYFYGSRYWLLKNLTITFMSNFKFMRWVETLTLVKGSKMRDIVILD